MVCRRLFPELPNFNKNEIQDKHKDKLMWQSYFFMLRGLQNNVTCFFKQHFYKQHQAEI